MQSMGDIHRGTNEDRTNGRTNGDSTYDDEGQFDRRKSWFTVVDADRGIIEEVRGSEDLMAIGIGKDKGRLDGQLGIGVVQGAVQASSSSVTQSFDGGDDERVREAIEAMSDGQDSQAPSSSSGSLLHIHTHTHNHTHSYTHTHNHTHTYELIHTIHTIYIVYI